jgi:hypothetical protein
MGRELYRCRLNEENVRSRKVGEGGRECEKRDRELTF